MTSCSCRWAMPCIFCPSPSTSCASLCLGNCNPRLRPSSLGECRFNTGSTSRNREGRFRENSRSGPPFSKDKTMSSPTTNSVPVTYFSPGGLGYVADLLDGEKWGGAYGTGVDLTYSFPLGTAHFISGGYGMYAYTSQDNFTGYGEFYSWSPLTSAEQSDVQS